MQKLKLLIVSILGISTFAVAGVPGAAIAEDIQNNLCNGAELTLNTGAGGCKPEPCENSSGKAESCEKTANDLIGKIINIFSIIVGIVAVIMIIYGGFRYITSGGDSNNLGAAKNTIIYAIVGLIIVALAQVIVRFVLGKATNVS